MILNLWSEDQGGLLRYMAEVHGSVLKIFVNIACIYIALTACVLYLLLV